MVFNKVAGRKKFVPSRERSSFGSKSSGFGGFRKRDGDSGSFERKEMHKAVCCECGMDCKVPFVPTEGKSVFCSECFTKRDGGEYKRPFQKSFERGNSTGRGQDKSFSSDGLERQLKEINTKLEKVLESMETISVYLKK